MDRPKWNQIHIGRDGRAAKLLKEMQATIPLLDPSLHVVLMPELAPILAKLERIGSARLL